MSDLQLMVSALGNLLKERYEIGALSCVCRVCRVNSPLLETPLHQAYCPVSVLDDLYRLLMREVIQQ